MTTAEPSLKTLGSCSAVKITDMKTSPAETITRSSTMTNDGLPAGAASGSSLAPTGAEGLGTDAPAGREPFGVLRGQGASDAAVIAQRGILRERREGIICARFLHAARV